MADAFAFPSTRWTLLSRMIRREDDAWGEFDRIYRHPITNFATRRGLPQADAQDVTQRVMCEVHEELPGLNRSRERGSFNGWLKQKIRWRADDFRRGRERQAAVPLDGDGGGQEGSLVERLADPAATTAEAAFDLEVARQLDAEIIRRLQQRVTMRPKKMQAFLLRWHDDWDTERIAAALEVKPAAWTSGSAGSARPMTRSWPGCGNGGIEAAPAGFPAPARPVGWPRWPTRFRRRFPTTRSCGGSARVRSARSGWAAT